MIYRLLPIFALVGLIIGVVVLSSPQREPAVATAVGGPLVAAAPGRGRGNSR